MAQEEEEKGCTGRTGCLKTGAKHSSKTCRKRGEGERRGREITEGERSHSEQGEGASWMKLVRTQREENVQRSLSWRRREVKESVSVV